MIQASTGQPLRQIRVSRVTGEEVQSDDITRGYEYAKGKFVAFSPEEVKLLEERRHNGVHIVEFVPEQELSVLQIAKSHFIGPELSSSRPFRLLVRAMRRQGVVAIGRWESSGKDFLVALCPFKKGLVMHQLYYDDEMRDYSLVDLGPDAEFSDDELDSAEQLIASFTASKLDTRRFRDEYNERVHDAVMRKLEESGEGTSDNG